MDPERSLATLVAQHGRVEDVVAAGVEPQHFKDDDARGIFEFCLTHSRKWGKAPSFQAVRESEAGKKFGFEPTTDSLEYVLHRFTGQVKRRVTLEGLQEIATVLDDPGTDHNQLDEMLVEVAWRVTRSVPGARASEFRDMRDRIARWKLRREEGAWQGIPMGIPEFDGLTMGVQKHEFVSVAGWQGTGKSTLMAYVTWHAYMHGTDVMIFSLEMGAEELMRKFDVMALNWEQDRADMVDSLRMKGADLSDQELERWEKLAEKAKDASGNIIVIDDVGRPTVERVYAEAVRRKPGMVCIDYISLMEPPRVTDNMWQDLTRLTRQLKLMARTLHVPVWGLAQTNVAGQAEGAQLHNIAYTRSIGQDSDIVLGLFATDEMKKNKQMDVRMLKNRDGRPAQTSMLWDPGLMRFDQWADHHAFEAKFGEHHAKEAQELSGGTP